MDNSVRFLLAHSGNKYFLKIVGTPRYTNCADFSYFISALISENQFEDILVDLSETDFLDSTSLGLLAKLAGAVVSKFDRKMTVISTNRDINDLLINTGFDQIMLLIEKPDDFNSELDELPAVNDVNKNMAKMMLEAHKILSDMNSENENEFKAVVEMLTSEVKKQQHS